MKQKTETINEITPTRFFSWIIAIFFSSLIQYLIIILISAIYSQGTFKDEAVVRQDIFLGTILFSATIFQMPIFAFIKLISFRAFLKRVKKQKRIFYALLISLFLSILTSIIFLFLLNVNWLGSSISSIIAMLIAIPIGMADAIIYVFLMEKIFTSINDA